MSNRNPIATFTGVLCLTLLYAAPCEADVVATSADGFQIRQTVSTQLDAEVVYKTLVDDFSKWWNPAHSYLGKAENLSIDLEQKCMLEKLPNGGFVRHMEVVVHQPGKLFRMTGGLGPLQEMGVYGALTFKLAEADGKTQVDMTYNVSGQSSLNLDKIATVVNKVLDEQLNLLVKLCEKKASNKL